MNFTLGKDTRASGLIVAAMSSAALFVNPEFLGYMPKFVLAGC